MKKQSKYSFATLLLLIISVSAKAQVPIISYSPTTNVFPVGTAITALTPSNSGGNVPANTYATVITFAGNTNGFNGSGNGSLTGSRFTNPAWTTIDYINNLMYVADAGNNLIRKIDLTANTVSLFAGSGSPAEADGTGPAASFNVPNAITYDGSGALYVADYAGNTIRKIVTSTGVVTTIATGLSSPTGIVYDPVSSSLYISNSGTNTILKMSTTGTYSVYAGSGTAGSSNGFGTAAAFNLPNGIAVDASGNLYVADQNNNAVRKISPGGTVTTFATGFNGPRGVDVDISGNLYVSDNGNLIYFVSIGGTVTTIAGNGTASLLNGVGTGTEFNQSRGVCVYKTTGDIYVSDYQNNVIRKITGTGYLISPNLPGGLSFTSSTGKISGTPSSTSNKTSYTVTAFNSSGSDTTAISIQSAQTNDWTAAANTTAWTTGGNWSTGNPPGASDIVQIGVVAYTKNRQPIITSAATVNSIVFGPYGSTSTTKFSSPTLTVNNSALKISWALTANVNATAIITGNTSSSLVMAPGSLITVNGTKLTVSTAKFKLQSDATGSASVGPVTTSNFVTPSTATTVERYLPAGTRGYRLLSSPVNTGTPDVNGNTVYSINYLLDSVYTSGTGASFNTTTAKYGNPSMYLFRCDMVPQYSTFLNSCYRGVADMSASPKYTLNLEPGTYNIPIGNGYLFYFRGGIATTTAAVAYTAGSTPGSATLAATGKLNQGPITFSHWKTDTQGLLYSTVSGDPSIEGFNVLGNPYACTIDLTTYATGGISMTNVSTFVYEYDPVYKVYGAYDISGNVPVGTSRASQYIASGQGFVVLATGTLPSSWTFNESCKVAPVQITGANLLLSKAPIAKIVPRYLRLQMALDSMSLDETIISFNNSAKTSYSPNEDAIYRAGSGKVSIASLSSDNKTIAINTMPLVAQSVSVRIRVGATANGTYSLNMNSMQGIPELYDIWLMDAYRKDSVDLRHNKSFRFDVVLADTNSYGAHRFTLVLRQNPAFAYHLLNFTANKATGRQVQVNWVTENEANYTNFTVERSTDGGTTYTVVGGLPSTGAGQYGLLDRNPGENNLYRLKQQDINNNITYSHIIPIGFANQANNLANSNINIYPNPAKSTVNMIINTAVNDKAAIYNFTITNNYGLVIKQGTSAQTNWQTDISSLLPGTYIIRVMNNETQRLVGESKLVKL